MRIAAAIILTFGLMGSIAAAAASEPSPPALDEIVVTAERAGPGMWRVHRGDASVWILGSISPLPRDITWRSKQVETVLERTSQVLVQKPIEISFPRILWMMVFDRKQFIIGGGKKLNDVVPPELHARFAAERSKVSDDANEWEKYRPIVAALFLQRAAFHKVNLSMRLDLGAALRELAKKHGVRIEEVKVAGVSDMLDALKTMPAATERTCFEASLSPVETGLPRLVDRAQAWADGNVERIENTPDLEEVDACRNALDAGKGAFDAISRVRQTWLDNVEKYLRSAGTTIAVVNLDLLLERGGLLDQLRAKGYEIDAP
jgi:uncharacterized protein YbaP (TraB family)